MSGKGMKIGLMGLRMGMGIENGIGMGNAMDAGYFEF